MANNPTPYIKNAGFFGGATELAQYLVETGAAHELCRFFLLSDSPKMIGYKN